MELHLSVTIVGPTVVFYRDGKLFKRWPLDEQQLKQFLALLMRYKEFVRPPDGAPITPFDMACSSMGDRFGRRYTKEIKALGIDLEADDMYFDLKWRTLVTLPDYPLAVASA